MIASRFFLHLWYLAGVVQKNKAWNTTIKVALTLTFAGMLAWQVMRRQQSADVFGEFLRQLSEGEMLQLTVLLVLMPVNWLLETIKWRLYLPETPAISWRVSLKSVLAGVTLSLLTPNRIGEYGGRVLFVPEGMRWEAAIATFAGSFAQNLVQVSLGAVGFYQIYWLNGIGGDQGDRMWLFILVVGILFASLLYFNIDLIYRWTRSMKFPGFLERGKQHLVMLKSYDRKTLGKGLLLAVLRYFVFCLQFVLALQFFGVEVPLPWAFWGIAVIYLFHAGVPLPPFIDIMARSQIALIIWQQFEPNELSVISASFFIWIVNLVLPAIIGLVAIEQVNVMGILGRTHRNEQT